MSYWKVKGNNMINIYLITNDKAAILNTKLKLNKNKSMTIVENYD